MNMDTPKAQPNVQEALMNMKMPSQQEVIKEALDILEKHAHGAIENCSFSFSVASW